MIYDGGDSQNVFYNNFGIGPNLRQTDGDQYH